MPVPVNVPRSVALAPEDPKRHISNQASLFTYRSLGAPTLRTDFRPPTTSGVLSTPAPPGWRVWKRLRWRGEPSGYCNFILLTRVFHRSRETRREIGKDPSPSLRRSMRRRWYAILATDSPDSLADRSDFRSKERQNATDLNNPDVERTLEYGSQIYRHGVYLTPDRSLDPGRARNEKPGDGWAPPIHTVPEHR